MSLKDVARRARVAVSTASLALNNKSRVSATTRERVQRAARELDYYPHSLARGLKRSRTETVGLFMRNFGGPVFNVLVEAFQRTLVEAGYDMIICINSDRVLRGRQIDGAVVLDPGVATTTIVRMAGRGCPVVVLDRVPRSRGVSAVLLDNRGGAAAAARHLLEQGYRDIVFVGGPPGSYDGAERRRGALEALRRSGLDNDVPCLVTDFTQSGGAAAVRAYLEAHPPPRAFLCANDETAIGALEVLGQRGLAVPAQVAVTGFDDIQLARYVRPTLTTVRAPREEVGRLAARGVLTALAGGEVRKVTRVGVELVVRESSRGGPV